MIELTGVKKDGTRESINIDDLSLEMQAKIKARFEIKAFIHDYMNYWTFSRSESDDEEFGECVDELTETITAWFFDKIGENALNQDISRLRGIIKTERDAVIKLLGDIETLAQRRR